MKVFVNVYDLHHTNDYSYYVGIGIFHSGVEIGDKEYSFGGHEFSYTGVFDITPRTAYGAKFRETHYLGDLHITPRELQRVIDELSDEFPGNSYHPLTRNCNTFSNELCMRLLKTGIPSYVNRLANVGSALSCFIPQSGLQLLGITAPTTGTNDDSNDLSNIHAGENNSRVNSPVSKSRGFFAFSGLGNSLLGSGTPTTTTTTFSTTMITTGTEGAESEETRRERAATAAYKRLSTYSTSSSVPNPDDGFQGVN